MRWLALYARSRQVPASVAAVLIIGVVMWSVTRGAANGDPNLDALSAAGAVAVAAPGLSGQDLTLDRTAAICWVLRRAAHVLLITALVGAVLLALRSAQDGPAGFGSAVRDSAGLTGVTAAGATVFGGRFAWTVPFGWCAIALFVPPTGFSGEVVAWMLHPSGSAVACWTAVLAAVGGAGYALAGPRR